MGNVKGRGGGVHDVLKRKIQGIICDAISAKVKMAENSQRIMLKRSDNLINNFDKKRQHVIICFINPGISEVGRNPRM